MADVFISYAREDVARVEPLVRLLEDQGWSVWWDRQLSPGARFGTEIEQQLESARCVVVFWSAHSARSNWVQAEANEGMERGVLVPVRLDSVTTPLVFRQLQTLDLSAGSGRAGAASTSVFVGAVAHQLKQSVAAPVNLAGSESGANKPRFWLGGAALAILLVIGGWQLLSRQANQTDLSLPNATKIGQAPAASIYVQPFQQMPDDIAAEIADQLVEVRELLVIRPDPLRAAAADASLTAQYVLQGAQDANELLVSLYNRDRASTQLAFSISLNDHSLFSASREIASRIARSFGKRLQGEAQATVPDTVYRRYLMARAALYAPLTPENQAATIAALEAVAAEAPRFAEASAGLCIAHISRYSSQQRIQDFEAAEKHCYRASRLGPHNPLVNVALGSLFTAGGQLDEAANSFATARAAAPFLTEAILGQAEVAWHQGDEAAANQDFARAKDLDPTNWRLYERVGGLLFTKGQFSDAVKEYETALGLVTDKPLILSDLGAAHFMLGEFEQAQLRWQESVQAAPNFSALSNLGAAQFYTRDFDGALQSYQRAIALNPGDYRIYLNAGEAALHASQDAAPFFQKLVTLCRAQLQINPDQREVQSALAVGLASMEQPGEAEAIISDLKEDAEPQVAVLYDLAVALVRLGRGDEANEVVTAMRLGGYPDTLIRQDANFRDLVLQD